MVYVTEDWSAFKSYAENCRVGTYQIKEVVEGVEIRVRAGRLGYIATYSDKENPDFKNVKKFCETSGFIKIELTISDEVFHV